MKKNVLADMKKDKANEEKIRWIDIVVIILITIIVAFAMERMMI